jgi:hypothetical protein
MQRQCSQEHKLSVQFPYIHKLEEINKHLPGHKPLPDFRPFTHCLYEYV